MLNLPRLLLCAALSACITAPASAEDAEIRLPLPGPVDARAAAMGGAGAALLDGGVGFFHNPAHLGFGQGAVFFGQTNLTGRSDISFDPKGASYRWRGWGLAWGNRIGQTDGVFDHTYLSAARRIGRHASAGVSGKFWRKHPSERFQFLGHAPVLDVGALLLPSERWTVGGRLSQTERGAGFERYAVGSSLRLGRFLFLVEWDGGGVSARNGTCQCAFSCASATAQGSRASASPRGRDRWRRGSHGCVWKAPMRFSYRATSRSSRRPNLYGGQRGAERCFNLHLN